MRALVGVRDPARHLTRMHRAITMKAEHRRRSSPGCTPPSKVVDGFAVDARRRAGLKPTLRQLHFLEPCAERRRRRVAGATGRVVLQTDVDQAGEESPAVSTTVSLSNVSPIWS